MFSQVKSEVDALDARTYVADPQPFEVQEATKQHRENAESASDDYYFEWASRNRRPMEYFQGRKRSLTTMRPREQRINGGLWRSGLIG